MENVNNNVHNFENMKPGFTYLCTGRKGNVFILVYRPYARGLFETEEECAAACEADADEKRIPFILEASIGCQCLDHLKVGDMCQVTFVDDKHVYVNKL